MLQALDRSGAALAMRPVATDGLAAMIGGGPLVWLDADSPTDDELAALAAACGWSDAVRSTVAAHAQRQRAVRAGDWGILTLRAPNGQGVGVLAIRDTLAVTVRFDWPVDLGVIVADLQAWSDVEAAGAMAVGCIVLGSLVDVYDSAADAIEERLVRQEASVLDASAGGDPLPALRDAAALRTEVGDTRRRANRLREAIGSVIRQELVDRRHGEAVDLELRDAYDHLLRVHDDLDAYSERLIALQDARLSLVAYRQNDITKKISGWGAVLLIPTITTGWYGQNFKHLLWLEQPAGPWFSAGVAVIAMVIAAVLLRRANWL